MKTDKKLGPWENTLYWLAEQVGNRAGRNVEVDETRISDYKYTDIGLRAPQLFAYAHIRKSGSAILLETKREWADKAGITVTSDRQTEYGWWGKGNAIWITDIENIDKLRKVVDALCKVLKVSAI